MCADQSNKLQGPDRLGIYHLVRSLRSSLKSNPAKPVVDVLADTLILQVTIHLAVKSGQPLARIRFRDAAAATKMGQHALQPIAGTVPSFCQWLPTNKLPQNTDDVPGKIVRFPACLLCDEGSCRFTSDCLAEKAFSRPEQAEQ